MSRLLIFVALVTALKVLGQVAVTSVRPGTQIQRGVFASAPSCASSQFIYSATDAALQGYCDGVSHLDWKYKGVTVTPTVITDLGIWFNQGGASTVTYPGSWSLVGTTGAGDNWRGRYKAVPSTPYSVVTCMEGLTGEKASGGFGMFWTDGTKLIAFAYGNQQSNVFGDLFVAKYNTAGPGQFSGFYVDSSSGATGTGLFCMAMVDDGANRKEKYSFDGNNWITYHSVGNTDFLTATGVGVIVNDAGLTVPPQAQIVSVVTLASAL